jgi:hypothetical protein
MCLAGLGASTFGGPGSVEGWLAQLQDQQQQQRLQEQPSSNDSACDAVLLCVYAVLLCVVGAQGVLFIVSSAIFVLLRHVTTSCNNGLLLELTLCVRLRRLCSSPEDGLNFVVAAAAVLQSCLMPSALATFSSATKCAQVGLPCASKCNRQLCLAVDSLSRGQPERHTVSTIKQSLETAIQAVSLPNHSVVKDWSLDTPHTQPLGVRNNCANSTLALICTQHTAISQSQTSRVIHFKRILHHHHLVTNTYSRS